MLSLNRLVTSGKVLYLGISDTPAWVVSKANEYARNHGLTQFSVYQGLWNASDRDIEREIVPMCEAEGMALAIWGSLGQGRFKSRAQRESGEGRTFFKPTEKEIKISDRLEDIANKRGTTITSVVSPVSLLMLLLSIQNSTLTVYNRLLPTLPTKLPMSIRLSAAARLNT